MKLATNATIKTSAGRGGQPMRFGSGLRAGPATTLSVATTSGAAGAFAGFAGLDIFP
jgi:hypothetical protein